MDIKANDYQITVTHDELWDIAFNMRFSLYEAFKNHWKYHQDAWERHEKKRLGLLKTMFYSIGRPDLFNEIKNEADKIFSEHNKKNDLV